VFLRSLFLSITGTISCVLSDGVLVDRLTIDSVVRQGCALARRICCGTGQGCCKNGGACYMFGVSIGESSFTDFDFADDVAFMSELYDILQSTLVIFEEEASELGLHVNGRKTLMSTQ